MIAKVKEHSDFYKTMVATTLLCVVFAVASLSVFFFVPRQKVVDSQKEIAVINDDVLQAPYPTTFEEEVIARAEDVSWIEAKNSFNMIKIEKGGLANVDKSLEFYRNVSTRSAVVWFYLRLTGNRDVTMAILEAADREDIPLSLAFALCYTESHFNRLARNVNVNGSIDRGLFQLNDRSFPRLENDDFYNPELSAKYGMQHLHYCMNVAGNDIAMAVAMYNAGISRVRNNQTPTSTLRYVGKITSYRAGIEEVFYEEVVSGFKKYELQNEQQIVPVVN